MPKYNKYHILIHFLLENRTTNTKVKVIKVQCIVQNQNHVLSSWA